MCRNAVEEFAVVFEGGAITSLRYAEDAFDTDYVVPGARLIEEIEAWPLQPLHAALFGSAARGDGDSSSDIDLLIVRPDRLEAVERWEEQIDRLRAVVRTWTGNRCQAFDIGRERLAEHVAAHDPLVDAWLTDGLHLTGSQLRDLVAEASITARLR